jgi:Thioredoxin like C-terminal domain
MTSISDRAMQDIEAANASHRRMYQLIRQPGPNGDRRFEIKFLDAGVEAFGFTFG